MIALLAVWGGTLLASMIPHGIGVSSDSILYLTGAKNLSQGLGWSRPSGEGTQEPITHFPPLYSFLLAAAGPGRDPARTAVPVAVLLLAGVIFASGAALLYVEEDPNAGVLAALLLAVSPILLSVSSWAMSEPLFLLLGLISLSALVLGLRESRVEWTLASGAAAGLAYLTRYVGVALVVTGFLLLCLRRGWSRSDRVRNLVAFAAPSVAAVAGWSLRNLVVGGTATNRSIVWHAVSLSKWKSPVGLLWNWLLPFEFDHAALLVMAAVLVALLGVSIVGIAGTWPRAPHAVDAWLHRPSLVGAAAVYLVVYSGSVALSLMFVDASTPIDNRIGVPVYLSLVMVLSAACSTGLRPSRPAWVRALLVAGVVGLVASYGHRTWRLVERVRPDGQGFASRAWQRSPVVAAARGLPPMELVYTNNREVFTFFTGAGVYGLPLERDSVTGTTNPQVADDLRGILDRLGQSGGAVVLFGRPEAETEWAYLAPLISELKLLVAAPDGRVYTSPDPG